MSVLSTHNLTKHFGGVHAVNGVTLAVAHGERHAVIGPNGAGKSTLFNLIAGELPVTSGTVRFQNRDITDLAVHVCAGLGIGRTFQRNNLFQGMNVLQNVQLAVQRQQRIAGRWFRPLDAYASLREAAESLLHQVGLQDAQGQTVSELAYGQQRALEIAVALAVKPNILLLDEPTAGMSPAETKNMVELIQGLPRSLTLMIVEHDMDVIFTIADRITVLHYGEVIASGAPADVRANAEVREIYLG